MGCIDVLQFSPFENIPPAIHYSTIQLPTFLPQINLYFIWSIHTFNYICKLLTTNMTTEITRKITLLFDAYTATIPVFVERERERERERVDSFL